MALEHEANPRTQSTEGNVPKSADTVAKNPDCSAIRLDEADATAQQSRFSGPIRTQERHGLAFADFERNIGEDRSTGAE